MINVFHYLGFLDKIMYTMGPNNHFRPMTMTGMDGNGYNMMNDGYFARFLQLWGALWVHVRAKLRIWVSWDLRFWRRKITV